MEEKITAPVEEQLNNQEWTMNFLQSLHERIVALEERFENNNPKRAEDIEVPEGHVLVKHGSMYATVVYEDMPGF